MTKLPKKEWKKMENTKYSHTYMIYTYTYIDHIHVHINALNKCLK